MTQHSQYRGLIPNPQNVASIVVLQSLRKYENEAYLRLNHREFIYLFLFIYALFAADSI